VLPEEEEPPDPVDEPPIDVLPLLTVKLLSVLPLVEVLAVTRAQLIVVVLLVKFVMKFTVPVVKSA
jgi:hypothetical protein